MGQSPTVAGISNSDGHGIIENTEGESGSGPVTLTVAAAADSSFNGYLRDTNTGSGVSALGLVKTGVGTLTLSGNHLTYTGPLAVQQGRLSIDTINNRSTPGPLGNNAGSVALGSGTTTAPFATRAQPLRRTKASTSPRAAGPSR